MKKTFPILLICIAYITRAQTPRLMLPIGHSGHITSLAFSPDGKYILTGSGDNSAKLWDRSGHELLSYNSHAFVVYTAVFSPDGRSILTGSGDYTAKLWDVAGPESNTFYGHKNYVYAVAFSPDGKNILTGSKDKTAKLWDIQTGKEVQTFIHAQAVTALAFAPASNGKSFLTGSENGAVQLWNIAAPAKPVQSFAGHTAAVTSVAFSPDGKFFLTAGRDKTARLWSVDGRLVNTFKNTAEIAAALFSPDGQQIITGDLYGKVKHWNLSGKIILNYNAHASEITAACFTPASAADTLAERFLLTGSADKTARLWNLSGRSVSTLKGHTNSVATLAFSSDGNFLFAGNADGAVKKWMLPGSGGLQNFSGFTQWTPSRAVSPDGRFILTGGAAGGAKLRDLSGQVQQTFPTSSTVIAVAFSPDGKSVLASTDQDSIRIWDLSGRPLHAFFIPARINSLALSPDGKTVVTGSRNGAAQCWDLSGNELCNFGRSDNIEVLSVAFSPDGKSILTGAFNGTVKCWELASGRQKAFAGHSGVVSAVTFTPDGNSIVAGYRNGTIKIWDPASGKERAMLVALDSTEWAVTTPEGLFDASPGAMKLMYYVQGREVIDLEQLKERYYEPGLLGKILGLNKDAARSAENFSAVALYPEMTARISEDKLKLQVTLIPRSGGIGKLSVFVNGKEVQEDANPQRAQSITVNLTEYAAYYLPGETNKLALRVYNEAGWLKSSALELDYRPPAEARGSGTNTSAAPALSGKGKPALFAVVVGTANYAGDKLDLKFADRDASLFSQALRAAAPNVFGQQVFVTLLNTDAADANRQDVSSKTTIKKAFADIAAQAKAQDVLVLYFSGHGVNYGAAEQGQFYYLTKDIASEDLKDPEIRKNYTVSSAEFTEWIKSIPALKQVMILDACNSGKIVEDLAGRKDLSSSQIRALDRMKDRTGMFILTGSAADKVSYEAGQYGQGLLTYSLLQGMSGLALTEDKRVDVMTLFQYSRDKVPDLAKGIGGIQTPILAFPVSGASFDIGIVDAQVKIPLAQVKPVFIRNNFQDEDSFDDVLGLTPALTSYFQQLTLEGAQASLIYVDVAEYENAYSMKGRYKQNGDAVEVRGRLFKGKTVKGAFQVTGKKSDLPGLVEAMVEKVSGMIE